MTTQTTQTSQIILIGGIKGGVGKSLISRSFVDYMIEKNYQYCLVDADAEIQDVQKYYPEAKVLAFSDDPKRMLEPDWISRKAVQQPGTTFIVNLPGNAYESFKAWLSFQVGRELKADEGQPQLVHVFVTDGSWASIRMFLKSINELGTKIPHILVRNNGSNRSAYGWDHVNDNLPQLATLMERHQVLDIEFPDIYAPILFQIDMQADLIRDDAGQPLMENGEYQFYLEDTERPKGQGYRFKDVVNHPDPMIGRRFYHELPNIYGFFDNLFQQSIFLHSPVCLSGEGQATTQEAPVTSASASTPETATTGSKTQDSSPLEALALLPTDLPPQLNQWMDQTAKLLKVDTGTLIRAISQLPTSLEKKQSLRDLFKQHLGKTSLSKKVTENDLTAARDQYNTAKQAVIEAQAA